MNHHKALVGICGFQLIIFFRWSVVGVEVERHLSVEVQQISHRASLTQLTKLAAAIAARGDEQSTLAAIDNY